MSRSSTIFDLSKEDLSSVLLTLKPSLNEDIVLSLSVCDLRSQITEWLLLHGLSTMHSFVRKGDSEEWRVPDKVDCISCGKYRVGSKGFSPPPVIMDQPLSSSQLFMFYEKEPAFLPLQENDRPISQTATIQKQGNDDEKYENGSASNGVAAMKSARNDLHHASKECCADCVKCCSSEDRWCNGLLMCLACKT
uniref:Developmental regulator n=1 Tax=Ascaris lumbricoides TaxID=6252 RepID=A0A0M3IC81_ASCLU